jgi:hypothetical protein
VIERQFIGFSGSIPKSTMAYGFRFIIQAFNGAIIYSDFEGIKMSF